MHNWKLLGFVLKHFGLIALQSQKELWSWIRMDGSWEKDIRNIWMELAIKWSGALGPSWGFEREDISTYTATVEELLGQINWNIKKISSVLPSDAPDNCQALVPIPVPPNPNPKPKAVLNQKVQLGLGLTLESHPGGQLVSWTRWTARSYIYISTYSGRRLPKTSRSGSSQVPSGLSMNPLTHPGWQVDDKVKNMG